MKTWDLMAVKAEISPMRLQGIKRVKSRVACLTVQAGVAFVTLAGSPARAASRHEITVTNSVEIKRGEKWNPHFWFGNQDEPLPPADYRPDDKHRVSKWYYRNPTHNLNFYVIGVADKKFRRAGRYPHDVFNPHGGWNWAVCKYKWWRLPFISFQRKSFGFYLGWRERGNFGAELAFKKSD